MKHLKLLSIVGCFLLTACSAPNALPADPVPEAPDALYRAGAEWNAGTHAILRLTCAEELEGESLSVWLVNMDSSEERLLGSYEASDSIAIPVFLSEDGHYVVRVTCDDGRAAEGLVEIHVETDVPLDDSAMEDALQPM